jgi:predicted AlkP superfamily phosphohydrolase/phosphomutase
MRPNRRVRGILLGAWLLAGAACGPRPRADPAGVRVVVLGFDGMDYALTKRLMDEGKLPHLARLAEEGGFQPLTTSVPPQSPVAWSEFITGLDAGGHGIFDFVHRDPATMLPYLSTSRTEPGGRVLHLGKWQLPLSGGKVTLLRQGTPFWQVLEDRGIPAWILRMPANFPPSGLATRELSGMGTPDLLGTYGTFAFFTTSVEPFSPDFQAQVFRAKLDAGVFRNQLRGPPDPFREDGRPVAAPFTVHVDADRPVAKITIGSQEALLLEGEWSEWLPVEFALAVPLQRLRATVRFFLRRVRPDLELYATPVNLDPLAPAMPISTPDGFAAELARATGRFYTQGMPEDTKALTAGVFDRDDFLKQAKLTATETRRQLHWLLPRFQNGFLFYYFGHIDQVSHMLWGATDPTHPGHDAAKDAAYAGVIEGLYIQADSIVGETLALLDGDATLVVMSDHGFTSWKRAFNLNTFLRQRGYLALSPGRPDSGAAYFPGVDWARTQAYAVGLNGLYVNLKGREVLGSVAPDQRRLIADELVGALLRVTDPATGEPVISRVYRREAIYRDTTYLDSGPDLIVGYAKGYRTSNESAVGQVSEELLSDNLDPWSGDHAMVHDAVPGILASSRPLRRPVTSLRELAADFGIEGFPTSRR